MTMRGIVQYKVPQQLEIISLEHQYYNIPLPWKDLLVSLF